MALAHHHKPNTERPPRSSRPRPTSSSSKPPRARKISSRSRPSSATIAFLATIGLSPSVVDGHPLQHPAEPDLPFLYPFIKPSSPPRVRARDTPTTASTSQAASTSSSAAAAATSSNAPAASVNVRGLPDQYIQGSDGLWRKTDDWSLYGSSACVMTTPSSVISNDINDQASDADPTAMAVDPNTTSSSTSLQEFDLTTLPQGWQPHEPLSEGVIIAILLLSLALAFLIVFFMVSCVVLRKKRRDRAKDAEKLRGGEGESDDQSSERLRQAAVSQRRWARASSRWKANVRFTARRRRRDKAVGSTDGPSSTTLCEDQDGYQPSISSFSRPASRISTSSSAGSRSRPQSFSEDVVAPSPPSSPRPSTSSLPTPDTDETPRSSMSTTPAPPPSRPGTTIPHPPAYYRHNGDAEDFGADVPSYPEDTPRPSSSKILLAAHVPSTPVHDAPEDGPPSPAFGGHVATDDKTMLARRAAMASAPVDDDVPHSALPLLVSAPDLADIVPMDFPLDDLGPSTPRVPDSPEPAYAPPLSGLPPPPAKGKLAISHFDEYPCAFERDEGLELDIQGVEPVFGPSAPPFDEGWERPGTPVDEVVPSAPPLEMDEEDASLGLDPSAPPPADEGVGESLSVQSLPDEPSAEVNHDEVPSLSVPP